MAAFQESEQHISSFQFCIPSVSTLAGSNIMWQNMKIKTVSFSASFNYALSPLLEIGWGGPTLKLKLVCLRRCMSCQLTRHVTLSRDPSPAHHLQISNKSKYMDCSNKITQYVKGYLVPKIGKVVSYISFLVRDPGFILYCVSLRIWRRLYTVTLSHRIAPEIWTKTHKI